MPPAIELARAHLEVQRDFFVELLIERHAPQPRTQRTLHVANTFETPAENFFHVAISAASCSRPASVSRYNLARRPELRRAPLGLDPPLAFEPIEGRIERAVFDQEGVAGRLLDEAGDRVSVARTTG